MKLKYYGHSCFTVESGGFVIALDPYDNNVPGYAPLHLKANAVYCSHGHGDHNFVQAVEMEEGSDNPFAVSEYGVSHDEQGGALRGENTLRIFEAEGKRIAHFGDCGCMPSDEVLEALKGADAILIPVGGYYTIDAQTAAKIAELSSPKLVIPMHFRRGEQGFDVIADIEEALAAFEGKGLKVKVFDYLEEAEI